jgi:hypothetical protein
MVELAGFFSKAHPGALERAGLLRPPGPGQVALDATAQLLRPGCTPLDNVE